jgi:multicopper oxidase
MDMNGGDLRRDDSPDPIQTATVLPDSMSRREFIATGTAALAGGVLVATGACGRDRAASDPPARVLIAQPTDLEIGAGNRVRAWTFDGRLPGPELRMTEGERIRVTLKNALDAPSSIHWHGMLQRGTNAMDGVPGTTQKPVAPGGSFTYDFVAEPAGTFFFHSHFGLQLEHGLYAPLIVQPKREPLSYDREYVVVIDDWPARSPEAMLGELLSGKAMGEMSGMMRTPLSTTRDTSGQMAMPQATPSSGSAGPGTTLIDSAMAVVPENEPDIAYRTFLINGQAPETPAAFDVRRGDRVRLRLINAGASTGFRVALAGHALRVTHADGAAVHPVTVDALEIAVGERYDVMIDAANPGVWALTATSVDEPRRGARALLRYVDARATAVPASLDQPAPAGRLLAYRDLLSVENAPWASRPDRVLDLPLRGQMSPYRWTIGGEARPGSATPAYGVRRSETVEVRMRNESPMHHPMHLHGHTFRLRAGTEAQGLWKDTVTVNPGATVNFQFVADNPGDWLFHCHHAYHQEAGMMSVIRYESGR